MHERRHISRLIERQAAGFLIPERTRSSWGASDAGCSFIDDVGLDVGWLWKFRLRGMRAGVEVG